MVAKALGAAGCGSHADAKTAAGVPGGELTRCDADEAGAVDTDDAGAGRDAFRVIGAAEFAGDFAGLCRFEAVGDRAAWLGPGEAAGLAVERAVELALAGEVDAVVTAPVHKPALAAAGYPPGHTEMLMALAGVSRVGMLMCEEGGGGGPCQAGPARDHPCAPGAGAGAGDHRAARHADPPARRRAARRLGDREAPHRALRAQSTRVGPRACSGTRNGTVYEPALAALAGRGLARVTGPVPADTVFRRAFAGEFDAVVAPYHDVGMAAFKTAAFGRGRERDDRATVRADLAGPWHLRSTSRGGAWPTRRR